MVKYVADTVNFEAAKADDVRGVICRASYGLSEDTSYLQWIPQIATADLPHGSYHYLQPNSSAVYQAQLFVSTRVPGDLGDWLDVEEAGLAWPKVRDFVVEYERLTGVDCGIYTSFGAWEGMIQWYDPGFAVRHPLWVANYNVHEPKIPRPWEGYRIWQYGVKRGVAWYDYKLGQNSAGLDFNLWGK